MRELLWLKIYAPLFFLVAVLGLLEIEYIMGGEYGIRWFLLLVYLTTMFIHLVFFI